MKFVGSGKSAPQPSRKNGTLPCDVLSMNVVDSCRSSVTLMPISASWAWMSVTTSVGWAT